MAHKHTHSEFIPSPFKVVNEYETEFVKLGTLMVAEATDDVLKELAKITSTSINELKSK